MPRIWVTASTLQCPLMNPLNCTALTTRFERTNTMSVR